MDHTEHDSPETTPAGSNSGAARQRRSRTHRRDDELIIVGEPPKVSGLPPEAAAALAKIIRDHLDRHGLRDISSGTTADNGTVR